MSYPFKIYMPCLFVLQLRQIQLWTWCSGKAVVLRVAAVKVSYLATQPWKRLWVVEIALFQKEGGIGRGCGVIYDIITTKAERQGKSFDVKYTEMGFELLFWK